MMWAFWLKSSVKGVAIKIANPETHIPLELNKNAEKSKSTLFAEEGNTYRVFVSPQYYIDLKTKGFVGTRNALGWKIDLTSENYANRNLNLKSELQLLNKLLKNY